MNLDLLIKKFKQKDIEAFEKLHDMYSDSVYGIINNIVKNDEIAKEITQDVFIKVWNNSDSYNSKKGRFFTWLLNVSRNAAIDYTRSKKFKETQQNIDIESFADIMGAAENLDNATDTIGLKEIVFKLGEKCKLVIDLIYFKGFTQKEASEALEMPIGTIKTRNRNCINDLRVLLGV